MVLSPMDSDIVTNSTPMAGLELGLNSLWVNLDKTAQMKYRYLLSREFPLDARFLSMGLHPRQCGQVILKFPGVKRTISRHQSHQSTHVICFGLPIPFRGFLADGRRTSKRKPESLASAMEVRFVRRKEEVKINHI